MKSLFKKCTKCGIEKPETEEFFYFRKSDKKFRNDCKQCANFRNRENYLKDKDRYTEYKREWYIKNKETKIKSYNELNREKILKTKKEYREKNRDRILSEKKEWDRKNKKHILNYARKYIKQKKVNDPYFKIKNDIRKNFATSFKRCRIKKTETFFSYTGIKFNIYVEHLKKSEYWNDFCNGKDIHIDHIIPCSAYDFNNPEEIKKCWQPENLRLITSIENLEKGDIINFDLIKKYNIEHLLPERLK